MDRFERFAVILKLMEGLRAAGSWCGETHVQKSSYFLKELLGVPLDYDFIMYKHGPFSFALRDELTEMRADRFLRVEPRDPYGPSLAPADRAGLLKDRFADRLAQYGEKIDFIAKEVGIHRVSELERLATALFVSSRAEDTDEVLIKRIQALKPHIQPNEAQRALRLLEALRREIGTRYRV